MEEHERAIDVETAKAESDERVTELPYSAEERRENCKVRYRTTTAKANRGVKRENRKNTAKLRRTIGRS